jgi:hypothetical protein
MFATVVVYSQVRYALAQGLRLKEDQALVVETACVGPFVTEVRRLPGGGDVACSEDLPLHMHSSGSGARSIGGRDTDVMNVAVMPGFLELYGLQPTLPVLWANLVAWPAGYFIMSRWLQGFAYRIDLAWWMFVPAGGVAVSIAWLTVSVQAFSVARARPVEALRYE